VTDRPLPSVEITAALDDVMPPTDEQWAWAHAHLNEALSPTDVVWTDADAVGAAVASALGRNPDVGYSRLLCPRKLAPGTGYHALLVPAFESGRLAGLGIDPAPLFGDAANGLTATASAWEPTRPARREPASRTTTAGTSAPARAATSSRSCARCGRASSTRAWDGATWTCWRPHPT